MTLALLIAIPFAAALAAWALGGAAARRLSLAALLADLVLSIVVWVRSGSPDDSGWLATLDLPWIPPLGIRFHLALDGVSLPLVVLTLFLGVVSVLASWSEIRERVPFFHLNLLGIIGAILGVFLAVDLFLFYFFWELMLVPMYFLIGIWGHENRRYAAIKFFLFTQAGSLLMLLAILGLVVAHQHATGVLTFDLRALTGTPLPPAIGFLLMLGFFAGFAVKIPAFPLHPWLPDAHTEAPTGGSVILAGLLLKTGAYGLLRFVLPIFPAASREFAPIAMALATAGILYGALLAFGQTDFKRLVAYTSVSHLGFVLLGIFAGTPLALQGALLEMICHGLSTGALFVLAGLLQERLHTRDLGRMGGFWTAVPAMGAAGLFFSLASLGLPGLGNFVAEFLVLFGAWPTGRLVTALATSGLVLATAYSLAIVARVFHGRTVEPVPAPDLRFREAISFAAMAAALLWLGLFPRPVLETAAPAIDLIQRQMGATMAVMGTIR